MCSKIITICKNNFWTKIFCDEIDILQMFFFLHCYFFVTHHYLVTNSCICYQILHHLRCYYQLLHWYIAWQIVHVLQQYFSVDVKKFLRWIITVYLALITNRQRKKFASLLSKLKSQNSCSDGWTNVSNL